MNPEIPAEGFTLILGGARSGKSAFAEQIGRESVGQVVFIATATASDEEMAERINTHRASRPASWQTLELPFNVGRVLYGQAPVSVIPASGHFVQPEALLTPRLPLHSAVIIVDCITLLVTNVLVSLPENTSAADVMQKVQTEIDELIAAQQHIGGRWLLVSNEVGLGLVPPYPLGRVYRDALGWANQRLARAAQRVIFMIAGIPTVIK